MYSPTPRWSASGGSSPEVLTPDPATAARGLLLEFEDRYGASDVPPVPVERIAKSLLGLLIEEHDDIRTLPNAPTDQGHLSGMLDPNEGIIYVDRAEAARSPQRKRFTIGHEIGHSRMHVVDTSGVFADPATHITELPAKAMAIQSEHKRRETEADMFASELLMPKLLVMEHARTTGFNLPALAERFDVSVPAIRLRLRLLGVLPKYMA